MPMPEYEEKRVSINGLNIHCLDWGDHNAQAMILLHGICSHAHYWDYFSRNMAQHFHILALDQRGHGESDWAQEYGPRHYVIDLETFVAQQRLSNIVLIGHSLGGITAALYAARHPELVGKLIMIDIGPELSEPGVQRMERERAGEPEEFQSLEEVVRYLQQL